MVGIVQPESFNVFIRKIGYSVGLEKTFERFTDFARLYAETPQIRQKDWLHLVHNVWGLKTTNIGDVFSSLQIAQISTQGVYAGPIGEAAGICVKYLSNRCAQEEALRNLLALAIVLADGDIFLNCLAADFRPEMVPSQLKKMLIGKREHLFIFFNSQMEREAIASAVTIERQKTNKGGSSKGGLNTLPSGGLSNTLKKFGLPKPIDVFSIEEPSQDYLRHILPSRKEWARTLGLVEGAGQLSDMGLHWLREFAGSPVSLHSKEWNLLPTRFELDREKLSAIKELMAICPTSWDYVYTVAKALGGTYAPDDTFAQSETLASITRTLFECYRELSQERRMLRNELPLLVALSAYMAISCSSHTPLVDYYSWLQDRRLEQYRIKIRTSRVIELGIIVS